MSFNQKSGKSYESKQSFKKNKISLYRKPLIVYEERINPKSQHETITINQSLEDDEKPIKQESKLTLPSIKKQKPSQSIQKRIKKLFQKSRLFVPDQNSISEREQEQNLLTVRQNKKRTSPQRKSLIYPGYNKLKKQEQSIILNYLNTKVENKKFKKSKRKVNKSLSNEKFVQKNRLFQVPATEMKKHKRYSTQSQMQNDDKIYFQQTLINRRQSLPHYAPQNLSIMQKNSQPVNNQRNIIQQLKNRIEKIKRFETLKENSFKMHTIDHIQKSEHASYQNLMFKQPIPKQTIKIDIHQKSHRNKNYFKQSKKNQSKNPKDDKNDSQQIEKQIQAQQRRQVLIGQQKKDFQRQKSQKNNENNAIKKCFQNQKIINNNKKEYLTFQKQLDLENANRIKKYQTNKQIHQELSFQNSNQDKNNDKCPDLKSWAEKQQINIKEEAPIEAIDNKNKQQSQINSSFQQNQRKMKSPICMSNKQFLKIKTYYASLDLKNLNQKSTSQIKKQNIKFEIPKLPSSNGLIQFIQNFKPQNQQYDIKQLMKHDHFQVIFEQNKELYFGLVENGKKQGYGITIKNNYIFQGFYKTGQKVKGIQIYPIGKYIGEFKNNKRQGKGDFLWKNGQKYTGDWLKGKKHGNGNWSSAHGDIYMGQWIDGKVEGQGIHLSSNGQHYQGSFHEYLKSGQGKQKLPNGDEYEGEFLLGKPHGRGKYTWKDGSIYEGNFSKGFRERFGILKDPSGSIYKGYFRDEQTFGLCQIFFSTKDYYEGSIQNGSFEGQGILKLYKSNQVWNGDWVLDEFIQAKSQTND